MGLLNFTQGRDGTKQGEGHPSYRAQDERRPPPAPAQPRTRVCHLHLAPRAGGQHHPSHSQHSSPARPGCASIFSLVPQPCCTHVRAERLSCATLSWHQPPELVPAPQGDSGRVQEARLLESQRGVPLPLSGRVPKTEGEAGAQNGGLPKTLTCLGPSSVPGKLPSGQGQGGSDTCPHCL